MMAHKHLHELLKEDQEPFQLKNYIADRRIQLRRPPISKKPSLESSALSCFFAFHDSPEVRKSPLNFPSPAKRKVPNSVFLHIPSKTSALLIEAAVRIQRQSFSSKPKTQIKKGGFGLFGSILKKFSRNFPRKCEKVQENLVGVSEKSASEIEISCSSNHSTSVWSESNEDKSLDFETSSSCRSADSEEIEFEPRERKIEDFSSEKRFCSSPQSPFRFALLKSPSPGRRTPEIFSPAASPSRCKEEEREDNEANTTQRIQLKDEEDEEEKEQFSPVSVLDPPFEDDDDKGGDEKEDGYLQCSYANVQRATHQLLHKLRRFEKLAELDPIELEKRMLEEEEDYEDDNREDEEEEEYFDVLVREVLSESSLYTGKISEDPKRLVWDLIAEEKREEKESEVVVKRVCKRLDSWKEMDSNTIDMMVELDFRKENDGWKSNREEMGEMVTGIEIAIFGLLLEEFSEELICSSGIQVEN